MAEDEIDPIEEAHGEFLSPTPPVVEPTVEEKLRALLEARQGAYRRVFAGNPMGDDVKTVIDDLRRFCRGDKAVFDTNERVQTLLTGRQEVYYRIQDHLKLSLDEIVERYTAKPEGT